MNVSALSFRPPWLASVAPVGGVAAARPVVDPVQRERSSGDRSSTTVEVCPTLSGSSPPASEARSVFSALATDGWTLESGTHPRYRNPRAGVPRFDSIDVDKARAIVENPGPMDPMHPPRCVHLTAPDGRRIDLANDEDVRAFAFFERGGTADALADPQLATSLAEIAERGYAVRGDGWYGQPGPLGAYTALRSGSRAEAKVGEFVAADLTQGTRFSLPAFEQQLRPAAEAGRVDPSALGEILQALPEPRDAAPFLAVADAVARGPANKEPLAARTKHALEAWNIVSDRLATAGGRAELPLLGRMLTHLPAAEIAAPARYLLDTVRHLPAGVSRNEREQTFWHVLGEEVQDPEQRSGQGPGALVADPERATEALVRRPLHAPLAPRMAAFDLLSEVAHRDVTRDFETLAACSDDLAVDAPRYAAVLAAAVPRNEDAAQAWMILVDVCRTRGWSLDEALPAFLSLWLDRRSAREALAELSVRPTLTPGQSGRVEQGSTTVTIGGITVPVRPGSH